MSTTVDETQIFFGAAASLTINGTEVGATMDPPVFAVEATIVSPEFQGVGGPVKGVSFVTKIKATLACTINEMTAAKLAMALPGSTSAAGTGMPVADAGAFATTLDGDTAIGVTLLPVAATTDGVSTHVIAAGEFIKVGTGAAAEFRTVKAIAASAAIEVTEALQKAHSSGDAVVRTVDLDTTTTTWRTGRVPSASFVDVAMDGVGLDGQHLIVTVTDAISDGKLEVSMADDAVAGAKVTFTGYYAGSDPTLAPFSVAVG